MENVLNIFFLKMPYYNEISKKKKYLKENTFPQLTSHSML